MLTIAAPFEGPRQFVERSRKHAAELSASLAVMERQLRMYFLRAPDAYGLEHYIVQFSDAPPLEMATILRDALNNLRVALDVLVADVARLHQKPAEEMDQVKFPFAKDADGLQSTLKRMKLPKDLHDVLLAVHPIHVPVNKWMRDLHDIDIAAKHRTFLPVYSVAPGTNPFQVPDAINETIKGVGINWNGLTAPWSHGTSVRVRQGIEPNSMFVRNGPFDLSFPQGLPFADCMVTPLLNLLGARVGNVINLFADLFDPRTEVAQRSKIRAAFGLP